MTTCKWPIVVDCATRAECVLSSGHAGPHDSGMVHDDDSGLVDAWDKYYGNLPAVIRRKLSVDEIRNLGQGFYLAFAMLLQNKVAAEREACAKVADAHKGSAEKARRKKFPNTLRDASQEAVREIQAEERGEDIAAEMIARAIRSRTT